MIKILFVDDEGNVSSGLKRMLRPLRHRWDVHFALSGQEALETMAKDSFDVIVSDIRMPGMTGTQLLGEVMKRHPQTVRIILSGYSEHEMVMDSVGTAHQFLSKPCDPDQLKITIERACALRNLLSNTALRSCLTQLQSLPSLPSLYVELIDELHSPDVSLKRISFIISQDPAMTAKILQMVNSAFFGLRRHVSNAEEAVKLLGVDMIASLALSLQVFSQFDQSKFNFSLESFFAHSLTVGKFARWLAKTEGSSASSEALTAGLLHDIGTLIIISNLPDKYNEILDQVKSEKLLRNEVETQVLGASHAEIGGYVLGLWGLPQTIVEAVAFHHEPCKSSIREFDPLAAVHVATALDREARATTDFEAKNCLLNYDYLNVLGVAHKIDGWREAYHAQINSPSN